MDTFFFLKRLFVIAQYRHAHILFKKEQKYYQRYLMKLAYHIETLGTTDIDKALEYSNEFEYKQRLRIKNGFFIKPRKALGLACEDVRDVLQGMKRWEGIG